MLQRTPRCNHGRSGAATASFRVAVALCTALLGAVVQQVAAANPLWPPIQRYEADGSLGSVAVSVPASFTQSQQGAAVSFRVQSTGSPACLTVVVDTRAGDSKLAPWYYSGSPPSLSNHDGYTQLDGGEGDSTAAVFQLPWVTGRVSTTVRVEYTGAQTVQVQVFPCYRLTNPTSVRMFTRTPLSLQSPAYEPDGPVNGAAEVNLLQSPGLSPPPQPDGVEAWGTIRLFTGCSCFNQPKAGGLALFSNIGKLLTPPARCSLAHRGDLSAARHWGCVLQRLQPVCGRHTHRPNKLLQLLLDRCWGGGGVVPSAGTHHICRRHVGTALVPFQGGSWYHVPCRGVPGTRLLHAGEQEKE